jgi:hypothetical protein
MRVSTDEILYELKLRLEKEKSIKQKVQLKQLVELVKQL